MKKFFALILFAGSLTGCSLGIYNGDFDCPAAKGLGCTSLSEVNAMVTEGKLGDWRQSRSNLNKTTPCPRKACLISPKSGEAS